MKYQYHQNQHGASISEYVCKNYFCQLGCDCGLTFEEAKEMVVSYYENRLEWAKNLKEEE